MSRELAARTKRFALDVIAVCRQLETDSTGRLLRPQLLRAGTSVGANYRASCRSKSRADFIAKLCTAEEEADETGYWIELLTESGCLAAAAAAPLLDEASQLTAIFVASIKTARGGRRASGR